MLELTFGDVLIYITCFFGLLTSFYFLLTLVENKHDLRDKIISKFPFVTIIVPAYNEEKTLEKTVKSLTALDYPKDKYEIIIIDDGSKDNTWKIAQKLAEKSLIVKAIHQENGGKGSALNHGIKIAKGDFVGALDADSFVDKNALKAIISRFDDPKTMAVTPSMKVYQASKFLEIIQEVEYVIGIFLRKVFAFIGSIHVTPGPFSIFRKSFFEKYGGYDEHNLTEDIEVALRIQSKGYHIENTLHAMVYTVPPDNFFGLLKQRLRWYYGFILNVEKYRHLFSVRTGNLGILIMPAAFISIFLVVLSLCYTIYKFFEWIGNTYSAINVLGYEYFNLFNLKIDFFNLFGNTSALAIITLLISVIIIILANKLSNKNKYIGIRFVIFSLFYWLFFGFWWLMAILYWLFGGRVRWGHRAL